MDIQSTLDQRIHDWEQIGHPAIMERFVRRNGKLYQPVNIGDRIRLTMGECFKNANDAISSGSCQVDGEYVEGFAVRPNFGILLHHAWVGYGDTAIDQTWDYPETCQYYGVEFDEDERWDEQLRTGYYGLLDNPKTMINLDLIFRRDPELKQIVEKITGHTINLTERVA